MKLPSRAMTWVTTLCLLSDSEPASHLVACLLIGLQVTSVTSQASGCMGPSEAGANTGLGMFDVDSVRWLWYEIFGINSSICIFHQSFHFS